MEYAVKECYMCRLPYSKPERWSPDGHINIERLQCSLRCFRMYRVAYESDNAFRLEHAIQRARDERREMGEEHARFRELGKWIRSLEKRLRSIRRTRRVNRRLKSLLSSKEK